MHLPKPTERTHRDEPNVRTLREDEMASACSGIVANVPSVERRQQWGGCTREEQRVYGESSVLSS